jgi:hypothetical protein
MDRDDRVQPRSQSAADEQLFVIERLEVAVDRNVPTGPQCEGDPPVPDELGLDPADAGTATGAVGFVVPCAPPVLVWVPPVVAPVVEELPVLVLLVLDPRVVVLDAGVVEPVPLAGVVADGDPDPVVPVEVVVLAGVGTPVLASAAMLGSASTAG